MQQGQPPSMIQPNYERARTLTIDRFDEIKAALSKLAAAHDPMYLLLTKFLSRLRFPGDAIDELSDDELPASLLIVDYLGGLDDPAQLEAALWSLVPPLGALYHDEHPAPICFRQNKVVFIDKLNVNISDIANQNPDFWWQPLNSPRLMECLQGIERLIKTFDPHADNFDFFQLKTEILN